MDFGDVIRAMKKDPSKKFARKGWNGKNMCIYLTVGHPVSVEDWTGPVKPTHEEGERGVILVQSHIDMYTAKGERVIGWLASQTDMLADDWEEVEQCRLSTRVSEDWRMPSPLVKPC